MLKAEAYEDFLDAHSDAYINRKQTKTIPAVLIER